MKVFSRTRLLINKLQLSSCKILSEVHLKQEKGIYFISRILLIISKVIYLDKNFIFSFISLLADNLLPGIHLTIYKCNINIMNDVPNERL